MLAAGTLSRTHPRRLVRWSCPSRERNPHKLVCGDRNFCFRRGGCYIRRGDATRNDAHAVRSGFTRILRFRARTGQRWRGWRRHSQLVDRICARARILYGYGKPLCHQGRRQRRPFRFTDAIAHGKDVSIWISHDRAAYQVAKVFVHRHQRLRQVCRLPAGIATDGAGDTVADVSGTIVRTLKISPPTSIHCQGKRLLLKHRANAVIAVVAMPTVPVIATSATVWFCVSMPRNIRWRQKSAPVPFGIRFQPLKDVIRITPCGGRWACRRVVAKYSLVFDYILSGPIRSRR